ncbi:hypothetical protein BJ741DRAFT_652770 [Chytriomyces cf. hyalinus JEL632]|nr:hypothetical protein BJ741DRAFT_652770 [Chytriomyces cf. hyalinus JEL632]
MAEMNHPSSQTRAAALTEMMHSLDRHLEEMNECLDRCQSVSPQPESAVKGVSIAQLHSTAVLSGHLPTLDQAFPSNESCRSAAAQEDRFFLLTSEADLFVFSNTHRDTLCDTFMSVQACSGYYHEAFQSWVLQIIGSILARDGLWIQDTWYLQVVSSHGLLMWLNSINKTIVTSREAKMKRSNIQPQHPPHRTMVERDSHATLRSSLVPAQQQAVHPPSTTSLRDTYRNSQAPMEFPDTVSPPSAQASLQRRVSAAPSKPKDNKRGSVRSGKAGKWWDSISCKPSSQSAFV